MKLSRYKRELSAALAYVALLVAGSALYKHAGGLTDAVSNLRRLAEEALAA